MWRNALDRRAARSAAFEGKCLIISSARALISPSRGSASAYTDNGQQRRKVHVWRVRPRKFGGETNSLPLVGTSVTLVIHWQPLAQRPRLLWNDNKSPTTLRALRSHLRTCTRKQRARCWRGIQGADRQLPRGYEAPEELTGGRRVSLQMQHGLVKRIGAPARYASTPLLLR
jgi:hypothetical protein